MDIILYHNHYDIQHLNAVAAQMQTLGAPAIRAIWSDVYGAWMAVEGCHRVRAAKALGLTPTIIDVSNDETVTVQDDGDNVDVSVSDLAADLTETAPSRTYIRF